MSTMRHSFIALTLVALLWGSLSVWRDSVSKRLHQIEVENIQFYFEYTAQTGKRPPPIRIGNRVIVPPPPGSTEPVEYHEPYIGVGSGLEGMWLQGGAFLGWVSPVLFHGAFAALTIVLARITFAKGSG